MFSEESLRLAQQFALMEMQKDLERQRAEIQQMKDDELMLENLLHNDLREFGIVDELKIDQEISKIEESLEMIRRRNPSCLPKTNYKDRPQSSRESDEEWECVRPSCGSINHPDHHRCWDCGLPRMSVNKEERTRCQCQLCLTGLSTNRLTAIPASEDNDWMVVDI